MKSNDERKSPPGEAAGFQSGTKTPSPATRRALLIRYTIGRFGWLLARDEYTVEVLPRG